MQFNLADWQNAQALGLNEVLFRDASEAEKIRTLASLFFGLAQGSLDLPFCSSLAAHSVISMDLITNFMNPEQCHKYLPLMRKPETIAAVCNSEDGAGSDLRKIRALCEINPDGTAVANIVKPCATNASHADLILASTWIRKAGERDSLGVVILEKNEVKQWSLQSELAGFRTGLTGAIQVQNLELNLPERMIKIKKKTVSGELNLFKRCFDMERLFLGVMVSGILSSIEDEMRKHILLKESSGFTHQDKQYLQHKLIDVYTVKVQISSIVNLILSQERLDLNGFSKELALLKILVNEQANHAVTKLYELLGHKGYLKNQICQKLMRDFMGLTYFGGTTELQKNSLFVELVKPANDFGAEAVSTKPVKTA
jgi:alkylation response protein AidB-like acyl-CoA dehydrogenase